METASFFGSSLLLSAKKDIVDSGTSGLLKTKVLLLKNKITTPIDFCLPEFFLIKIIFLLFINKYLLF